MIVARRSLHLLLALAGAVVAVGSCAGDDPTDPLFRGTTVTIQDAPDDGVLLQDRTLQLRAAVRSDDGEQLTDIPVTWRSSNTERATVSATGEVTPMTMGEVQISAAAGGATDTRPMSVRLAVPLPASRDEGPLTSTLLDGLVRLTVPARAVDSDEVLHIRPAVAPPANSRLIAGAAVDLGPASLRFDESVTLALEYPDEVPVLERSFLRIFRVDDGRWTIVGGTLDLTQGRVRTNISRAGTYALFRRSTPASLVLGSGDGQQAALGGTVSAKPRVVARDDAAAPVEGAVVRFAVLSGGGMIVGADSGVSDGAGEAALLGEWQLGQSPGANALRASLVGVSAPAVTFTATATAAPALSVSHDEVSFDATVGASPPPRFVQVTATTALGGLSLGPVTYPIGDASGWLQASLDRTSTPAALRVAPLSSSLPASDYVARIPIRSSVPGVVAETVLVHLGVRHGSTSAVVVTRQVAGAVSGFVATTQPRVELRTSTGALSPVNVMVQVELESGAGTLSGTRSVMAVNGVATFVDLRLDGWGSHRLRFSTGGVSQDGSSFTVQQLLASLVVLVQPNDAEEDRNFKVQPVIGLRDHAGLPFMSPKTVTASVASGSGDLEGSESVASSGGVAAYHNLKIDDATGPHVLRFRTTGPTLTVNSASFDVRDR